MLRSFYSQKLDKEQMDLILSNPSSLNPFWLTILAEQLRTFGDFRTLDQHISSLSGSVASLLQITIKDLVSNDDSWKMEKVIQSLSEL